VETDEVLETGYGRGAPAGDNLHNDYAQAEANAYAALGHARGDAVADDERFGLMLSDSGSPTPFGNIAVLRRPLRDREWEDAAHAMHEFYAARAGGPFMLFSAWPTPTLHDLGFGLVGHPPLMFRPPGPISGASPEGLEIRAVKDDVALGDWERVMVEGYPVPELQPYTPGGIVGRGFLGAAGWHHYVGYLDGEPVATGSAFVGDSLVHVEFISALESARGRGVGRAITAAATLSAPELPAMLISSDLGRPVYDGLGYRALLRYTLWAGHRGS
jgi:hypothetical protein